MNQAVLFMTVNNQRLYVFFRVYQGIMAVFLFLAALTAVAGDANPITTAPGCDHALTIATDRDIYVSGEMVFLRIMALDRDDLDDSGELVNLVMIRNNDGSRFEFVTQLRSSVWYGSFYLEDTLQTGWYDLVAFTNTMRESWHECAGKTKLYVVNRFDRVFEEVMQDAGSDAPVVENWRQQSMNRSTPAENQRTGITISTHKERYSRREQVRLSFEIADKAYRDAVLTVSVVPGSSVFTDVPEKGLINSPARHSDSYHPREINGLSLSGKIMGRHDHHPLDGRKIMLSTPDTIANLLYTLTDVSGRFHFKLNEYYWGKEVYLQLFDSQIPTDDCTIVADHRFELEHLSFLPRRAFPYGAREYILQAQQSVRVFRAFEKEPQWIQYASQKEGFLHRLFFDPDYIVRPGEFEQLNDFREISRELLHGVRVRSGTSDDYRIALLNGRDDLSFFNHPPQVFINGVATTDYQHIFSLSSDDILEVRLLNRHWALGDLNFYGILSLYVEEYSFMEAFQGLWHELPAIIPQNIPKMPDYREDSFADEPDFRQLLFWNPYLLLSDTETGELQFFCSDTEGVYVVKVVAVLPDKSRDVFYHYFVVEP